MKKVVNIFTIAECIIITLLYLFALYYFREHIVVFRLIFSIVCLFLGNGIILSLFTSLINFDQNKIYGLKLELFSLGFILQIAAFVLLKGRVI